MSDIGNAAETGDATSNVTSADDDTGTLAALFKSKNRQYKGLDTPASDALGNNDSRVSEYLKTWICGEGLAVCGVTGPGTSKEVMANWSSPFEGESLGNKNALAGGSIQMLSEITSITTLNSRQVWNGNQPTKFNIELKFYALQDVAKEVMNPIRALEEMIAPETSQTVGTGRIPGQVAICIGRKVIYKGCVIESMSQPYDKEVYRGGGWIRCTVNLQVSTIAMLNKSEIPAYGG